MATDPAPDAAQVPPACPGDTTQPGPSRAGAPVIGPYSRSHRLRGLDRRTRLARHVDALEAGLIAHVGGAPSVALRCLIDQVIGLEIQIKLLEQKGLTRDRDRRAYQAWCNAKRLTLRAIGMDKAPQKRTSLFEYLAAPEPKSDA